jgi:hypothetical protein
MLAIEYLHGQGLVCRDLKPENVLITHDGHLVLTDMGFCKPVKPGERTFTTCGTADYMAPEVRWWSSTMDSRGTHDSHAAGKVDTCRRKPAFSSTSLPFRVQKPSERARRSVVCVVGGGCRIRAERFCRVGVPRRSPLWTPQCVSPQGLCEYACVCVSHMSTLHHV